MNMLELSIAYLRRRPLTTALNVLLLALGVSVIAFLLLLERGLENRLSRDVAGIDMVVGAKGSPLQIVLSTVMQVDVPTGNVPLSTVETLRQNPMVRQAIPVAIGDSFGQYRIVGTEPAYIDHYAGRLAEGRLFTAPMEAVLGSEVAATARISVGGALVGSHGLTAGGEAHAETPYQVVGVLAPTGTVLDRLVLTPVASVWAVHEHHHHHHDRDEDGDHSDHDDHDEADAAHDHEHADTAEADEHREVTAVLVRYATPLAAARLPREINSQTALQAASPATEMLRLRSLMGIGVDAMRLLGLVLIIAAGLSTFVALTNSLQERRYDLAVMRALGAGQKRVAGQILTEAVMVTMGGVGLGLGLAHGGIVLLSALSSRMRDIGLSATAFVPGEMLLPALGLAVALLASALPAIQVYRGDVSRLLARG